MFIIIYLKRNSAISKILSKIQAQIYKVQTFKKNSIYMYQIKPHFQKKCQLLKMKTYFANFDNFQRRTYLKKNVIS